MFFSSKYKLEVVGESLVYTHLMKHRRNEHVSFLGYHGVSFRDQFLTCRMAVIPSYCRLINLRISPGLPDRQHEGSTIPLNAGNCSHRRQNLHDSLLQGMSNEVQNIAVSQLYATALNEKEWDSGQCQWDCIPSVWDGV